MQMITKKMYCDVAVIGGGAAGVSAAISAARRGQRVIIFEKGAALGGLSTSGYVTMVAGMIEGNCKEWVLRMEAEGELLRRSPTDDHNPSFDPEYSKYLFEQLIMESGGRIIFDATCFDVEMDGNKIKTALFFTKGGWMAVHAKMYIDSTGDADVAAMSGVPYEVGGADFGGLNMSSTIGTRWSRANFDKYRVANDEWIKEQADRGIPENKRTVLQYEAERRAVEAGDLDRIYSSVLGPVFFKLPQYPDDCADYTTYMFHSYYCRNTDVEDISRQIIEQHRQVIIYEKFLRKYLPGYENVNLVGIGALPGSRDSRRIYGEYMMKTTDVICGVKFDDGIARFPEFLDTHHPTSPRQIFMRHGHMKAPAGTAVCHEPTYDLDMHPFVCPPGLEARPDPRDYCEVPYRSLVPIGVDNLLVAGRCCSSEFHANGSIRIIGPAMGTGQAAGVAADYALKNNVIPRDVDGRDIRKIMVEEDGVELDKIPDGHWNNIRNLKGNLEVARFGDFAIIVNPDYDMHKEAAEI